MERKKKKTPHAEVEQPVNLRAVYARGCIQVSRSAATVVAGLIGTSHNKEY